MIVIIIINSYSNYLNAINEKHNVKEVENQNIVQFALINYYLFSLV